MDPMQVLWLMDEFSVENPSTNPIAGGRAAIGTAAGMVLATLAASAWARLELNTWKVNEIGQYQVRLKLAGAYMVTAAVGAGLAARSGTRRAAVVGTMLGVAAAQAPLVWDPHLIKRHPVLGNIWQYVVPIGGALLGVNAVT